MAAPGRQPLAYIPVPLLLRPQPVALTLHALFSHVPQNHHRQRGEDAVTGIQQGWMPLSGRNCSITPSDTSERGDIRTWPVFTVLCSRVQAPVVPITGRHPGRASNERQFHLSPDDCRRAD